MENIFDFLNGEQEKKQTIDFIKFSREWITSTTIKGAPNYTTAVNALVRFIGKEELNINYQNFDRDRIVLYDDDKVYQTLLENGLFQEFSNSYLIEIQKGKE